MRAITHVHMLLFLVCGAMLVVSEEKHTFYSHAGFGDLTYQSRAECDWLLWGQDQDMRILLDFNAFEVEDEPECRSVLG